MANITIMVRLFTLLAFSMLLTSASKDSIIYEWRGPGRTGVYRETNLMKAWPAGGPKELWTIENIGNGFASPVFAGENLFITGETDSMSILYCFDRNGRKQWQAALGREWVKTTPGARSTPTIAGDYIYVGTGLGNLYCVDRKSGKTIWSKELERDFRGVLPLHGHSESPLICDDKVFWTPGGKDHNVVALDRFTGKLIWSDKGFGERSAYNSPELIVYRGKKIIITFTAYHMLGFEAETGKLLWSQEQDNYPVDQRTPGNGDTHSNTVIYDSGIIYYAAGDGNCGVKLALSEDGTGIKQIWRNPGFDSFMGGIVKIGDYLYGCGTAKADVRSINIKTGLINDSLRVGSGVIIAADDMLYYYNQKGEMMLLNYDKGKIGMVSSFRITGGTKQHFSHPVINNGVLYLRRGNVLMAFDISKN